MERISFHGVGLHSGQQCSVTLERRAGPVAFLIAGSSATLAELSIVRTDRGVTVRAGDGPGEVDLVEHLFAAFAGLSIRSGVAVTLPGPEVPLLDGGAAELTRALIALAPPRQGPSLSVAESGEVRVGSACYRFEPDDSVCVEVEVDFDREAIGRQSACFNGNPKRFANEIAPARTFGFASEGKALRAAGRARRVDPHAVIVLDDDGRAIDPSAAPRPGELARHKLLDLLGDLFVHGGPPRGRISAEKPGHGATHAAVAEALARGLLRRH